MSYTATLQPQGLLAAAENGFVYQFGAMGSPCEIRMETHDASLALSLGEIAEAEALRIEHKYSRYLKDSCVSHINQSGGKAVALDAETVGLIAYADQCYTLSAGQFDITSGVLRRVWRFDGSANIPSPEEVDGLRDRVGWSKVGWHPPEISLPLDMEIDLGGLAKEYAVDLAVQRLQAISDTPVLVNFGGDLRVSGPRAKGGRWRVAIESVEDDSGTEGVIELSDGAITTSGDARRYLFKDGVRYGHILDPRTGWPVRDAPRSVTVAAPTCVEAGILSTLAMLHGRDAWSFLKSEGVKAWVLF
ncbi:hypothetical protein AEAC466_05870 [Asticcacaulis sp. AC466]|uniref:FAD:protein FMN transferase n=1 Tax=Asticcacaulis sp. AC466 TaxID=1282362 RepID=UPI0003C3ACEB|nr:FAD:protein FMN transferase [Asticcacaulis sp. AC466]ESQ85237.1 hypothetical protein AEAC466_05870 [Asticcacaulis sp. AC466]